MLAARRMMNRRVRTVVPFSFSGTGVSVGATHSDTTGSFTPAANALIIVPVHFGSASTVTFSASDTLGGLTWTQVSSGFASGTGIRTSIFWAIAPSSPIAGAVTITASNSSTYFTIGDVVQLTSGFTPASPIAQSATNYTSGSSTAGTINFTVTLGSAPTGLVLALLAQSYDNTSPTAPTDDPDFTHLSWIRGVNSFDRDLDVSYAVAQQSSTWTNLPLNHFGFWYYQGLLVEIQ